MVPFSLTFKAGVALYEQVAYAAKKAIITGQILPGDAFPSVRDLSTELKINPSTAHKVITNLISEGLIEVHSGRGTFVSGRAPSTAGERSELLKNELEQLVVQAKKLGLGLDDVTGAVKQHWWRLERPQKPLRKRA